MNKKNLALALAAYSEWVHEEGQDARPLQRRAKVAEIAESFGLRARTLIKRLPSDLVTMRVGPLMMRQQEILIPQ